MLGLGGRLTHHDWLQLVLWSSFILRFATARESEQLSYTATPSLATSAIATETVDFSSALQVAASVAPELALSNFSNPIPLPIDAPNYDEVSQIAALFPPLQQSIGKPDISAFAEIHAPTNSSNSAQKRQGVLRVLVVGDSMTHCYEGDYTWRYRIWEWFRSQNVAVDFVGPYPGTAEPEAPAPPATPPLYRSTLPEIPLHVSGTYPANFDSSHFAIAGRAAAVVQGQIQGVTANYPADLMLVMLGFNDLGWFYSDDNGLIASMKNLITNARRSNPNMKFVIGTVPHRTFIGGRQDLVTNTDSYNRMLKAQSPGWSTATSPVVVAPVREEYDCGPQYSTNCPAAFDGLHPNELGEYQIARAFSRALVSGLGIGNTALVVPGDIPARPLPVPQNLQMGPSPLGLTATWDKVYGAYGYDVEYRINGGAPFNFSPGYTRSSRWDTRWALDGWTYDIRVRASAGNRQSGWTGWISGTARPQTADNPTNVVTRASATGLMVTWTPPTGSYTDSVFLYNVYYWDLDTPCTFLLSGGFQGTSAHIDDLIPGRRYLIAVEAWNSAGAGFPTIAKSVIVGGGTPGTPQNLQIQAHDPTTVHMTWDAVPGAAGYNLYSRNVNQAGSQFQSANSSDGGPCVDVYFMFPGTWNYEWVVSAYNGDDESSRSSPKTAPRPQEGASVPFCPATGTPGCSGGSPPATEPIDPSDPVPGNPGSGTPTTTALPSTGGTQVPTCKSGGPEYLCKTCSDIGDSRASDSDRWKAAKGDEALLAYHHWWIEVNEGQHGGLKELGEQGTYVRALAWRFNGPENWVCSLVEGTDCDDNVSCDESDNPAVSLIMNQWSTMRSFYANQYDALGDAVLSVNLNIGNFAKTFSPEMKADKSFKILMDIVTMGFGIFAATPWTTLFRGVATTGFTRGAAGAVVASSLSIGKDQLDNPPKQLDIQNDLSSALSETAKFYQKVLDNIVNELFSGSEKGRVAMEAQLKDGKWSASALKSLKVTSMQESIERMLYGSLLTTAWEQRPFSNVFFAVVDEKDHTGNPTNVVGGGNNEEIKDDDMAKARVAYGDQTFWLLDYGDCENISNDEFGFPACWKGGPVIAPGVESLQQPKTFWQFNMVQVVSSAVDAWRLSEGANNYEIDEFTMDSLGTKTDLPWEGDVRTPGFFDIPVCEYRMAALAYLSVTFEGQEPCDNYPCCIYDTLSDRKAQDELLAEFHQNGKRWKRALKPKAKYTKNPKVNKIWRTLAKKYSN